MRDKFFTLDFSQRDETEHADGACVLDLERLYQSVNQLLGKFLIANYG